MNQIRPHPLPLIIDQQMSRSNKPTATEWLLIRSYRAWVKGLRHGEQRLWNDAWNGFLSEFGTRNGKLGLTWFVRIVNVLRAHAERRLSYHEPGCPCIGEDEWRLVAVVSACQHGDAGLARRWAETLVPSEAAAELIAAAGQLGLVLGDGREPMPLRRLGAVDFDLASIPASSMAIN